MHPTVKPTDHPDFEIDDEVNAKTQECILKFLYYNGGSADKRELLPTSFYRMEKLEDSLSRLEDKGLVEKENGGYKLAESATE